jgi:hypothetical protein
VPRCWQLSGKNLFSFDLCGLKSFCVWIVRYRSCWCCRIITEAAAVMEIEVHRLTNNPTAAWNELSKKQQVIKLQVTPPTSNVADDKVRYAFGIHCM